MSAPRAIFQSTHIDTLSRAARAAGLSWKSGTLTKADIIDRLCAYPSIAAAAAAMIQRQGATGGGRVTWKTATGAKPSSVADWLDDDEPQAPSVARPTLAPTNEASINMADFIHRADLAPYALKADVQSAHEGFNHRLSASVRALADHSEWAQKENTALRAQIKALEDSRPPQIIIGQNPPVTLTRRVHRQFPDLLAWLSTIGRVILTGPAGTGKSRAAAQCAEALALPFYLQTPFTQSYEYLGHRDAQGVFHETPTFQAYTKGGVLLMDEADSSSPDAFLAANPILDGNGFAMFGDGQLHKQHPDFRVILNMNTMGDGASMSYSGRNPLDGATIARFGGMLHWEVDPSLEAEMSAGLDSWHAAVKAVRTLMQQRSILTVNATPRHVLIGAQLLQNDHFKNRRAFVLEASLKNGPLVDIWPDILRLPAVSAFLNGA